MSGIPGRAGRFVASVVARVGLALAIAATLVACDVVAEADPELGPVSGVIRASAIEFEPAEITARAGVNLSITFENADDGIPHGLALVEGETIVAQSEIINGPGRTTLDLPPMGSGVYALTCPVHPNMTGTLTVVP